MTCIFEGYLNEAKDLFAEAYKAAGNVGYGPEFRDAARDAAFARGWALHPASMDTSDTREELEFQGLTLALLFMSQVQALHGLEPLGVMVGALEAGWEARAAEMVAASACGGGDDVA